MGAVEVQIKGIEKLVKQMEKYPAISEKHVNRAINRSLVRILGQEKQQAPVFTGNLRDNWRLDIGRFEGSLRSNAPYSAAVHEGTRPHMPPISAIEVWARKKGLNPWAVAKSIAKKGTKANPFLKRAVEMEQENVNKEFAEALRSITKELSQS